MHFYLNYDIIPLVGVHHFTNEGVFIMNREKIKLLIELSETVEDADAIIVGAGFTAVREKWAYLKGMFDFTLVGRFDGISVSEEAAIEMDYYAALGAIINSKWEA